MGLLALLAIGLAAWAARQIPTGPQAAPPMAAAALSGP